MNTWIMNLNITRDNNETFIERLTDLSELDKNIELNKTKNAHNIDDISVGDRVYLCFGGSDNQTKNIVVRGFYAIIEKLGYKDSKKEITLFKIVKCYGRKEETINGMKYYTTLFPRDLFDESFKKYSHSLFMQAGKNSISIEKNLEFINNFIAELDRLKLQTIAKIL